MIPMAPIPGESLTREPGNAPWEQPPHYSTPEEALGFYFDKFSSEDSMEDLLYLLDKGMPLSGLIESLLTVGVMQGYHSIDVSMIIAPIIHEYFMNLADVAGIKVKEDVVDEEDRKKEKLKRRLLMEINGMFGDEVKDPSLQAMPEQGVPQAMPQEAPTAPPQSPQQGIIPRRA